MNADSAPSAPPAPAPACASTGPHGEPCQVEGAHVTHESSYGGHVMRWDDSTSRLAPAPASEWDEMDRLAHDAMSRNRAIASPAEELLARACTPERVAQLVAVARETEALRRMLEKSTVRLGILRDRMEGCDHDHDALGRQKYHMLSLDEVPAWIEEQQAAARASRPPSGADDA